MEMAVVCMGFFHIVCTNLCWRAFSPGYCLRSPAGLHCWHGYCMGFQ
jgi:hypothetical protein